MSKGPATEGRLGDLHNKVAEVMIRALDQIERSQENYDARVGTEDEPDISPDLPPALLSVMVKFLDSNKITCAPEEGNSMSELERKLNDKKKKRRTVGNVVHLDDE